MPVRNEVEVIRESVRAILAQNYPRESLEVIVVDGMSTDGTREVLAAMAIDDQRLIVLDNPRHIVSYALNAATPLARGDVVGGSGRWPGRRV